ncbi:hypothetical protein CSC2_12690 [Clostridium zeae]|uniref:Uncharacterized protein n=1 Tax=Clostridium zeae TaxID=2759022 RepID=A0ABQ1E7J8_9CLOT|nr:hypothetical protein [Clostridium zeae]GFZ30743.1 hypothetical protein CSC2_12690 [Clostridium zeae]
MLKLEKNFKNDPEVPHELDIDVDMVSIAFEVPYEFDIKLLLHDKTWTSLEDEYHRLRGEATYEEVEDKLLSFEVRIEELEEKLQQLNNYFS